MIYNKDIDPYKLMNVFDKELNKMYKFKKETSLDEIIEQFDLEFDAEIILTNYGNKVSNAIIEPLKYSIEDKVEQITALGYVLTSTIFAGIGIGLMESKFILEGLSTAHAIGAVIGILGGAGLESETHVGGWIVAKLYASKKVNDVEDERNTYRNQAINQLNQLSNDRY